MNAPRYFLAKYIPDLRRSEPRNVGVVLWSDNGIAARFLGERPGRPGEVLARHVPAFVTSRPAYKQWVEFWRAELSRAEIESVSRPGVKAGRNSVQYLDVFADSSRGNFVLTEGGQLLDPVEDPQDAADFLFERLVETPTSDEPRDPTLDEICEQRIDAANLRDDPHFLSGFPVEREFTPGVDERFEFSHAYKNGSIRRLYQRVPLSPRKSSQRKTIHDAAWMFDRVTKAHIVEPADAVSLVYLPDDPSSELTKLLGALGTVSRVLDVGDEKATDQEFRSLLTLTYH